MNSEYDTKSSHRRTRTCLIFLDEALCANDQTDHESLLATNNDDLNLFLDGSDDWDDPQYQTPIPDVRYVFTPFVCRLFAGLLGYFVFLT